MEFEDQALAARYLLTKLKEGEEPVTRTVQLRPPAETEVEFSAFLAELGERETGWRAAREELLKLPPDGRINLTMHGEARLMTVRAAVPVDGETELSVRLTLEPVEREG